MGKTISIKVLFGIYLLLMAGVVMSMAGQVLEQVQPLFMLISTL
ncbi:adhesin [Shigella sonnei]|nr:adhesin [Shigella sonnei]